MAKTVAQKFEAQLTAPANPSGGSLQDGWERLAAIVGDLRFLIGDGDGDGNGDGDGDGDGAPPATECPFGRKTAAERQRRASQELRCYLQFLRDDLAVVPTYLFDLHVATRSVLPVGVEVEQPVELIQVSADTRSILAPNRVTAAAKLNGMQLHHFGAFYKPSWRANDWAWADWTTPARSSTCCSILGVSVSSPKSHPPANGTEPVVLRGAAPERA
ncbi:DUF3376 domain-containing protein [Streptomyces sp. C184]|uniref:DUF3376 domain-containing protein n=1 Tax=Streptomyces sp. C184 TaxID=3237121 RepID=UPI0034C5B246